MGWCRLGPIAREVRGMATTLGGAFRCAAAGRAALRGICLVAALTPLAAQSDRPPAEALASLQERGRLIALYLQAVDKAADLLKAQGSGASPSDRTVVIPDREGWRVMYVGDSSRDLAASGMVRKGLSIVAETTFSPDAGQLGTLALVIPPRTAPATIQSYVRSLEQAEIATIGRPEGGRPLLEAVVREKDGTFTVYVISQQREEGERDAAAGMAGSVLFGRDYMVRIAASGRQVLSVEKLHDGHASMPLQPRAPGAPLLHEHDKGDLPAPTDVALVLRQPVLAPLLVLTGRFMFRVDREGEVTWLGPNPTPSARPARSPVPPGGGGAP